MSNRSAFALTVTAIGIVATIASAVGSCVVEPTPTPTSTVTNTVSPTGTPDPLRTRLAQMEATIVVWETIMPDVMQTAEALYYLSLTPCPGGCVTPTPTPVLCQRCLTNADCPEGYTCRTCATCYQLCVRIVSPNGDCTNCLNAGPIK